MKFRAVSSETKLNYLLWRVRKEINNENRYLRTLGYDPQPIIDEVKHHIDKWDPIQLLALDCPEDEYDGETRTISIYVTKHLEDIDTDSFSKVINKIFQDSFQNEFVKSHESIHIASDIINSLRTKKMIKL
ncbi:DUF1871 family protein [Paenibacillus sp. UNC451MF]|uniref:DUF1871 family protein n=1 Tax=Paenibacillus sp. UNC451MF TaxID=1449063 RepID=UPI00048A8799|nr:DUF1871 family protein [Paenibacillus sp. UNC451MF]